MKKNKLITIILAALTAVFVLGAIVSVKKPAAAGQQQTSAGSGQRAAGASPARTATPVRVVTVETGVIQNSIVINGDILAGKEVSIYPSMSGKLVSTRFKPGETVTQGQVLAMVDPSRPGDVYAQSPVLSTITGTVLAVPANTGDTVSANTAVYIVGDISNTVIETFVPERFAASVSEGQAASVSFEAIKDETFAATVSEVSPALDPASRTVRIRLKFDRKDSRVKPGMFAQVSLVTQERDGVLTVPRNSIINTYGSFIVFVVDGNNIAHQTEITVGLESETLVEAAAGLVLGDRVVYEGQNFLTDGDPVRIID